MHHTMSGKGLKTLLIRPSEHLRSSFPQGIGSGCWLQAGLIHRFKKSSYSPDGHSILLSYLPLSALLASYLCFLLFPCAVWADFCSGPATPLLTLGFACFWAVPLLTLLPHLESPAPALPATLLPTESSSLLKNSS